MAPLKTPSSSPFRPRPFLKKFLPQTLFGRSLLIIVVPLILLQVISLWIFYDRHWENITEKLANSVASDISLVEILVDATPTEQAVQELLKTVGQRTGLDFYILPVKTFSSQKKNAGFDPLRWALQGALEKKFKTPFYIISKPDTGEYEVFVLTTHHVLRVTVPNRRIFSSGTYIYLIWVIGLSAVLFAVALIFMRNQIRPIRRLAIAAEAFGKGRTVPDFRPSGAREVRRAAQAFLIMRERIQRQISQRTEMLTGVSHDLRTPLTRMKLALAMLPSNPALQGLEHDVRDMENMVEAYLAFARGEGEEVSQTADLTAFTRDIITNLERSDPGRIFFVPSHAIVISFRPLALKRCISNILGNALRYASQAWVSLHYDSETATICVDDNGPGIPEDQREDVFRPFFRLENSRNSISGGIGLGLTIARDIARSQGGDVTLMASAKGGLRVLIQIPL